MSAAPDPEVDRDKAELDRLWAKYADQGLLDEGIDQEGFTSFAGPGVEEIVPDG